MPRFQTSAPLSIKGDRIERGTEIELTAAEAAQYDPADLIPVSGAGVETPEVTTEVPLEEMTQAQLKERAKDLGLKTTGSVADLRERIELHLAQVETPEVTTEVQENAEGA